MTTIGVVSRRSSKMDTKEADQKGAELERRRAEREAQAEAK